MEYALRGYDEKRTYSVSYLVLILILMEYALRDVARAAVAAEKRKKS